MDTYIDRVEYICMASLADTTLRYCHVENALKTILAHLTLILSCIYRIILFTPFMKYTLVISK